MPNKKKITGHSNLTVAVTEKVAESEALSLTTPKQKKPKLKNFLLSELDCERLIKVAKEANKASPYKKVSETAIIKGLILLATKLDIEKLLKATKEA